jgi:hypothetical protein
MYMTYDWVFGSRTFNVRLVSTQSTSCDQMWTTLHPFLAGTFAWVATHEDPKSAIPATCSQI